MAESPIGRMWPDDIADLRRFVVGELLNRRERYAASVAKALRKLAAEIEQK